MNDSCLLYTSNVFLARKHCRDFAELLFGQRHGLPDTFRSILLHFSEKLTEVARDVYKRQTSSAGIWANEKR